LEDSKPPKNHPAMATFDLAKATGVEKLLRNIRQGQLAEGHLLLLGHRPASLDDPSGKGCSHGIPQPWDPGIVSWKPIEKDVEKPPVVDRISMFFHIVNGYSRVNTYGYHGLMTICKMGR